MMKEILSEGGRQSSMRFHLVLVSIGILAILLAVGFYVVMAAIHQQEPKWPELSIFAVGVGGIIVGAGYNKTSQKKLELNSRNENV